MNASAWGAICPVGFGMSEKSLPIVSVYLDIARFVLETSLIQSDAELGKWSRELARCLALRDHSLHKFGSELLRNAEGYRDSISEKRRQAALTRWGKTDKNAGSDANAMQNNAPVPFAMQTMLKIDQEGRKEDQEERKKTTLVAAAPGADVDKPKRTREPNPIFDAVVSLFGFSAITPSTGKRIGKVTSELRARGATAETVAAAFATAEKIWNVPFKPEALVVNWELLQRSQNVGNGTGKNHENGTGRRNRRDGEFHEDLKL